MSDYSLGIAPTVDPKGIPFFNKLSPEWWDINGPVKLLHSVSKLNLQLIQDHFIDGGFVNQELSDTPISLTDKLILDVGCGGGLFSEPLAKLGGTVTGVDINATLIDVAKQHASLDPSLTNLTYLLESIEEHSSTNPETYDAVVANFVLEHVKNPELFLNACAKCVKPGGFIFVTCMGKTMISWLIGIILYENILRIIPPGTHDWNKFVAVDDAKAILEQNKCTAKLVSGIFYNSFINKWSLMANKSLFYVIIATKDN